MRVLLPPLFLRYSASLRLTFPPPELVDRLENEHLGNMDQYRVTREVPLPYSFEMQSNEEEEEHEPSPEPDSGEGGGGGKSEGEESAPAQGVGSLVEESNGAVEEWRPRLTFAHSLLACLRGE